jgi:thymidylate kinase
MGTVEWPPRCIHLAGADGSGKTTQARAVIGWLAQHGRTSQYVWLRFPRLLCTPFLVYARLRGYSYQETVEGERYGYWDFGRSWAMRRLFPWALLVDTLLMALIRIYWPLLRGETVVCDRFVADVLVDLMLGIGDPCLDQRLPGRLFVGLLPRGSRTVVIDLDTALAIARTPALRADRTRGARRELYLGLAARHGWPVVSAAAAPDVVTEELVEKLRT